MGRLHDLRFALAERIGTVADMTVYPLIPDSPNVPCAWIEPGRPFVDYQDVFRGRSGLWHFDVTIITNRIDVESAQEALDEYLDPDGPFVAGLQADDITDALSALTNNYVQVLTASRYGSYRVGGTNYLGVQINVCLHA